MDRTWTGRVEDFRIAQISMAFGSECSKLFSSVTVDVSSLSGKRLRGNTPLPSRRSSNAYTICNYMFCISTDVNRVF
jgi:hypothetical protein